MLNLPSQILDLFTPKERIIVDVLRQNQNKFIQTNQLAYHIYSSSLECDLPQNEEGVVKTFVYRIRQKLKGYPYCIDYKYMEGYRLTVQSDVQSLNNVVQMAIMDSLRVFSDKREAAMQLGISERQLDSFLNDETINLSVRKTAQTIRSEIMTERGVGGKAFNHHKGMSQ